MTFLIHYLVRTAVTPIDFDIVSDGPITAASIPSLRVALARDAGLKLVRDIPASDIVIANIIPIPYGEPKQQGGS
jgi:hypothetical protein